jgi:sugar phosphate isomerase/epimerase
MDGAAREYLDLFKRNVELCADLGSPAIRVDAAAEPGSLADWDYHRGCDRLASVWAEAAEIAGSASVNVVWEFEPAFAFNKPSEVATLHRKVGHPNFQILFNTAHAYVCGVAGLRQHGNRETLHGGVPEFLKKLEGRVGALHLIDSDGTLDGGQNTHRRPFGDGYIDFRALAPQLLDIPKLKWWCIDLVGCPDPWDLIEPSRDFVLDLINTKVAA